MTSREGMDADDDFSEIYKAYTGPLGPNVQDSTTSNKRSRMGSDGEEEAQDPNAVPTDFTSREARVWEAKSKATERNWKKRKEEEMICKICGESGHFTQGCPSTLGANRKSQDFFERVPARDPHVKALFSEDIVGKIEKDIGCKIKIDEKFIIVSGKDRVILKKGVDAVHKVKDEGESKCVQKFPEESGLQSSSKASISQSRLFENRSPVASRLGRSDSQKSNRSPRSTAQITHRYGRQDRVVEDRVREDLQRLSSGSPQAGAFRSDGARVRSNHSKSPARSSFTGNTYNSFDGHNQNKDGLRTDGRNADRVGSNLQLGHSFEYPSLSHTLENLELQYKRDALELSRIRDTEEDQENCKHREAVREIRESYIKRVTLQKGTHAKMWEEFLQRETRKRQQAHPRIAASGFDYKKSSYPEFDSSYGNLHHSGTNIHSRLRYPSDKDSYASRPHDTYDDLQRNRHDDFVKPYNRY